MVRYDIRLAIQCPQMACVGSVWDPWGERTEHSSGCHTLGTKMAIYEFYPTLTILTNDELNMSHPDLCTQSVMCMVANQSCRSCTGPVQNLMVWKILKKTCGSCMIPMQASYRTSAAGSNSSDRKYWNWCRCIQRRDLAGLFWQQVGLML